MKSVRVACFPASGYLAAASAVCVVCFRDSVDNIGCKVLEALVMRSVRCVFSWKEGPEFQEEQSLHIPAVDQEASAISIFSSSVISPLDACVRDRSLAVAIAGVFLLEQVSALALCWFWCSCVHWRV